MLTDFPIISGTDHIKLYFLTGYRLPDISGKERISTVSTQLENTIPQSEARTDLFCQQMKHNSIFKKIKLILEENLKNFQHSSSDHQNNY